MHDFFFSFYFYLNIRMKMHKYWNQIIAKPVEKKIKEEGTCDYF